MRIIIIFTVTMPCKSANAWNISAEKLSKLDE
jgi:hypothetical protein